ncbi:MAG: sugar transporter substrate-binding protein [Conexibacter sp.]|nr:sugar transporter substrate-binding protein [Conexibacter sp.]
MLRINRRRGAASLASVLAVVAFAGCGSSGDDSGASASPSTAAATTSAAPAVAFDSPESGLPATFPDPTPKAGFKYTVGYLSPNTSIGFLAAVANGVKQQTEKLGGKFIAYDAQFNQDKQVSQFGDLLAQKPDVIVAYPLLPTALAAKVAQAKKMGIPVVTNDTPPVAGEPLPDGYATNVHQGLDIARYSIAKALAKDAPGAKYALLGVGLPVPSLKYAMERSRYWGDKFGMRFAGEVDATDDTPTGGQQAMTAILAKYPDVDVVIAYNDTAAEAAVSVARSSGKPKIKIAGDGGDATAVRLIRSGQLWGTYGPDEAGIGRQQALAAYNLVTKQNLPLPKEIVIKSGTMVTKGNADNYTPANGA